MSRLAFAASAALALAACTDSGFDLAAPPGPPGPGSIVGKALVRLPGSIDSKPASGAQVSVLKTNVRAVANDAGVFVLAPITTDDGTVLLQFDEDGDGTFERQRFLRFADLGAAPGRDVNAGDVFLRENATLHGRAVLADKRASRSGHGGITVFVPQGPFTAISADDGSFAFENLPEGQLTLAFFRDGYLPETRDGIALRPGEAVSLADVVLTQRAGEPPEGAVEGTVAFNPALADASGTTIEAKSLAKAVALPVDAGGAFSGKAPFGLYAVTVAHDGYGAVTIPNVLLASAEPVSLGRIVLAEAQAVPPPVTEPEKNPVAPTVDVSAPFAVGVGAADVVLDASKTTGPAGHALAYRWSEVSGAPVTLVDADLARARFTAPSLPGALRFSVEVTDVVTAAKASRQVEVEVAEPPVAKLLAPRSVRAASAVTLDASASTAPSSHPLAFAWKGPAGLTFLPSAQDPKPTFTAPSTAGIVEVEVAVTDKLTGLAATAKAQVAVDGPTAIVLAPPQAAAGATVSLDGTMSTGAGTLSFAWQQLNGDAVILSANNSPQAGVVTFKAPAAAQTLRFALTVTDATSKLADTATFSLPVVVPPTAKVSAPAVVETGKEAQLDAGQSFADGVAPGAGLSFKWEQTAGATVAFSVNDSALASRPKFTAPATAQKLAFKLVVTDARNGLTGQASFTVDVAAPPVAVISPATVKLTPNATFVLDGSASSDPSGAALSYAWSCPDGTITIPTNQQGLAKPTLSTPGQKATFPVELVVSNGVLASAPARVLVEVDASLVTNPTVSAGPDQTANVGDTITLTGAATHPNTAETFTYAWTQVSGTPAVTLAGANTAAPTFVGPIGATTLVFRLTVTGSSGGVGTDDVAVTVQDLAPPKVVSSNPPANGLASPYYMTVTFDEELDPASITTSSVILARGIWQTPMQRKWDAASKTLSLYFDVPLEAGTGYSLQINGVIDNSPNKNRTPQTNIDFAAQARAWDLYTTTDTTTGPSANLFVHPSVGVGPTGPVVEGMRYSSCDPNGQGTWSLSPSNGALVTESFCAGQDVRFVARPRTMHQLGNQLYRLIGFSNGLGGTSEIPYKRTATGWQSMGFGADGGQIRAFSDGESQLSGLFADNSQGISLRSFDPGAAKWTADQQVVAGVAGSAYFCAQTLAGAAAPGLTYVVGNRYTAGSCYYEQPPATAGQLVGYVKSGSTWAALPGVGVNNYVYSSAMSVPLAAVTTAKDLLVVFSEGTNLHAFLYRPGPAAWTDLGLVNGSSPVGTWDMTVRGQQALVAFTSGTSLLLREANLASASPAWVDVPAPGGGSALNANVACVPSEPSLAAARDGVYLAWAESCSTNTYTVALRKQR